LVFRMAGGFGFFLGLFMRCLAKTQNGGQLKPSSYLTFHPYRPFPGGG
jgi:hypothetical protein